jgi:hypothetical protein
LPFTIGPVDALECKMETQLPLANSRSEAAAIPCFENLRGSSGASARSPEGDPPARLSSSRGVKTLALFGSLLSFRWPGLPPLPPLLRT